MRILYVEDNPANLFLVKRVARMGNHEVMNYIDGADVLANFGQDNPDLVLMDIQLVGDLTGLDVVRELRKQGFKTPIVAVTAYAMAGDRERCLEAGCDEYMAKPLSVPVLIELLGRYESALKSGNIASAIPASGVHEETSSTLSTATEAPTTSTQDSTTATDTGTAEEKPAAEASSATTSEATSTSTSAESTTASTQDSSSATGDANTSTDERSTDTSGESKSATTASNAESANRKAESTDTTASEVSTTSNGNSAASTSNSTNGNPPSN